MSRRVALDTTVLAWMVDPATPLPGAPDGTAGRAADRLEYLFATLAQERAEVIIPAPVLAEIFAVAGRDPAAILADLTGRRAFSVGAFDERAAIECGMLLRGFAPAPDAGTPGSRTRLKFDAQIVAIAKAQGASTIYAADDGLIARAKRAGLAAPFVWELPLPPEEPQGTLWAHWPPPDE